MSDEQVPVFLPPLRVALEQLEREKGAPLTETEVVAARAVARVIMMRRSFAEKMAAERGYEDIDPANCWEEWQRLRG
jgi:hypothetical protein